MMPPRGIIENTPSAFAAAIAGRLRHRVRSPDQRRRRSHGVSRRRARPADRRQRTARRHDGRRAQARAVPAHRRPHDHARRIVRPRRRPRRRCSSRSRAGSTATCGSSRAPPRCSPAIAAAAALMSFDPAPIAALRDARAAPAARHRRRAALHASPNGGRCRRAPSARSPTSSTRCTAARNSSPIRSTTCRRRSRGSARNVLRPAAADLDGAHRRGPRTRRALRRPDDLRGISAISLHD